MVRCGEAVSLAHGMALAEKRVLKRSFDAVDADGSGRVDAQEVCHHLRNLELVVELVRCCWCAELPGTQAPDAQTAYALKLTYT